MATTKKPAAKAPAKKAATPAKPTAPAKKAAQPAKKVTPAKTTATKPAAAKKPAAKPATAKASAKPAAKKAASAKPPAKRVTNAAFMKPMNLSPELTAVVGAGPLPRTEVTKKIWEYIKSNNLQVESNRRMIQADKKLKPIFGGKEQVGMFELTRLVNAHLS